MSDTSATFSPPDFRALFEASPDAYLVVLSNAPEYTIVAASSAYLNATMTRRDNIIGRGLFEIFSDDPDDAIATGVNSLRASFEIVRRDRKPHVMSVQRYDVPRRAELGGGFETRYWAPLNSPLFGADGEVQYIHHRIASDAIAGDITERRRIEKEYIELLASIRQERARMGNIVASVPGVVWEAWGDPDAQEQRIDFVSSYVETMLGYSVQEWLSTPNFWLSIVHPEDREAAAKEAHRAFTHEDAHTNEFRWMTKDGRALWVESYSVVVRDETGRALGMRGVTIDISDRKRAEVEREQYLAEIESLNVRLQRAMRETHHRVKNNLQVISALINIQTMDYSDIVPVKEFHRLSHHIHALASIHDLLTQQSRTDPENEDLSLQAALEMLTPTLQSMMQGRSLHVEADDIRLPIQYGTTVAVLMNELISNAIKHGSGDVTLTFAVRGTVAHLEVRDHGAGFPADFNPEKSAHTGLDLITSLAAWDLQGKTRFENHPDGGARVSIEFLLPTMSLSA